MSENPAGPVAVIGGGTMGPGMAVQFALAGCSVSLVDVADSLLDRARTTARAVAETLVAAGKLAPELLSEVLGRISYTTDLAAAVAETRFVVECVPELISIKEQVFAQLEAAAPADAILASNTSGIPISRLQHGRKHPGNIVGMHWSNPPHVIPVIEIIPGEQTAPAVLAATEAMVRRIRMVPAHVKRDVPGFVENRILYAILREAFHLLDAGVATAQEIDTIVRWGIGMKLAVVGPLELVDMAGLDIYRAVATYLNRDLSVSAEVSAQVVERVNRGELGVKTGSGLFQYDSAIGPQLRDARGQALLAVRGVLEEHPIPRPDR